MKRAALLLTIVSLFIISCKQPTKSVSKISNCENSIDSITALYYNYSFNSIKAIKCNDMTEPYIPDLRYDSEGLYDAEIIDCDILKKIEKEITYLSPDTLQYSLDARIVVRIYYKTGEIRELCMNDNTPNDIFIDGVRQVNNNKLIFLIKNNIGYYSWFENPYNNEVELKDTSFVKEALIESPYYKQYQATKNDHLSY